MKYEKKCKIVRLNSNTKANIGDFIISYTPHNKSLNCGKKVQEPFNMECIEQHLYILAPEDEELKINDKVYSPEWIIEFIKNEEQLKFHKTFKSKKVIASTDPSLNLPRPSNEFLKKYCEEGGIDEVMVEYEETDPKVFISVTKAPFVRLKVAPDNTITIRKVKDTWTREEVEKLILKYWKELASNGDGNKQDCVNWIKENL